MDNHTFIGKRKVGSTEICDFTDYQGIGRDPLYKRYESVYSIVKKYVISQYIHFLAAPDYSAKDDAVNWYIDEWTETPEPLSTLQADKKDKYQRIKQDTLNHYKQILNNLSGEELQVIACALRYIDDEFIFCCDDKVYVIAWGMTPDTRKHISKGELVHEAPSLTKFQLTFDIGGHGSLLSKHNSHIYLSEGTEISANDIPQVIPSDGYVFSGWEPNPLGVNVCSDMTFVANYNQVNTPPVIPPVPPVPPAPLNAICHFNAGNNGTLNGASEVTKAIGSRLSASDIPNVTPRKGFIFQGWDKNPLDSLVREDITYNAVYKQHLPWFKRLWLWLTGSGCLKWLLWVLLTLLLLLVFSWLFKDCHGCTRAINGVEEPDKIVTATGDTIDDNGVSNPISLHDGKLPDDSYIVAPIRDEDGNIPPIERKPGVPPVISNRLFLFLENDNDDIDTLAADFKKAYPGDQYCIIGFDREVKSLLIQIPETERDEIRRTIPSKLPTQSFIVFDE